MRVNHNNHRLFDYINNPSKDDYFILGEVVFNMSSYQVGVIIQCHGNNEYRTDMFGNCCEDIRLATDAEIKKFRPDLLK